MPAQEIKARLLRVGTGMYIRVLLRDVDLQPALPAPNINSPGPFSLYLNGTHCRCVPRCKQHVRSLCSHNIPPSLPPVPRLRPSPHSPPSGRPLRLLADSLRDTPSLSLHTHVSAHSQHVDKNRLLELTEARKTHGSSRQLAGFYLDSII